VEVVVAAISAGIALAALAVSFVVAKRQTATQERLAAIEEARRAEEVEAQGRAHVSVSIARPGPAETVASTVAPVTVSWHVWLVLRNDGPALARGVEVTDEGCRPRESWGWRSSPPTCSRPSRWCSPSP
jgi:hypothetical protein